MTEFQVTNLQSGLDELAVNLERINPEKIRKETLRRSAYEMEKMVRLAIKDEKRIRSPASLNSPFESGPGTPISQGRSWVVEEDAGTYSLRPAPKIRQRAIVLNYGYPGKITPNTSDKLWFEINGVPHSVDEVDGPEYTGYWQKALDKFQSSNRIGEIGAEELNAEFEDNF